MKIKTLRVSITLARATGLRQRRPRHTVRVTVEMNLKVAAGLFLDLAAG